MPLGWRHEQVTNIERRARHEYRKPERCRVALLSRGDGFCSAGRGGGLCCVGGGGPGGVRAVTAYPRTEPKSVDNPVNIPGCCANATTMGVFGGKFAPRFA